MQTTTDPMRIIARVTAAILGSWLFTWGCAALSIGTMVASGISYDQASVGAMLFAFLIFVSAFLWSFVATSIVRVWLTLAGGGTIMTLLAWWLQRSLIG